MKNRLIFPILSLSLLVNTMNGQTPSAGVSNFLATSRLDDSDVPSGSSADAQAFVEYVVPNKDFVLSHFTQLAPTSEQQKVLCVGLEFQTGANYLATLQSLVAMRQANQISDDVLIFAVMATAPKRGFLSYNFQNQNVRNVVQAAAAVVKDDRFRIFCKSILNGTQKAIDTRSIEQSEGQQPEILQ